MLNIDPTMHAVVQAALGADYFSGAMTPAKALAAIDVTDELRAPQGLSLTEVGPSMHSMCLACQLLCAPLLHVQSPSLHEYFLYKHVC